MQYVEFWGGMGDKPRVTATWGNNPSVKKEDEVTTCLGAFLSNYGGRKDTFLVTVEDLYEGHPEDNEEVSFYVDEDTSQQLALLFLEIHNQLVRRK